MIHGIEGIEHSERVLEDGLNFAPEQHPVFSAQRMNILTFVKDLTRGGCNESQQQHCQGGFSATAFASHCHDGGLSIIQSQRNIIQSGCRNLCEQSPRVDFRNVFEFK